jgi:hypothetical protein
MLAVTAVFAVNCDPPPLVAVYHPPNIYPVLTGGAGRVPTVVCGVINFMLEGLAGVVAPWLSKVTTDVDKSWSLRLTIEAQE